MNTNWASKTAQDLLSELAEVEQAITRSSTFNHHTDRAGGTHVSISPELLDLAEREQGLVSELRRRHRVPLAA